MFLQSRFALAVIFVFLSAAASAQLDTSRYSMLRWRSIGPFRGGRTVGAMGVPSQPNVFYIGVNNGGVWKTTDYGRTWLPIFDSQPTGSIGDLVVSPSNPNVIYVGSGEGLLRPDLSVGDGIYRSGDGGKTWTNTGLQDAQQIGGMAIDPVNENRVFVAAMGHPYGPNPERGIFRTTDGGGTWQKVLFIDENTGATQVVIDPKDPNTIYADMWAGRMGPWENGMWNGAGSGLYKSTDGGNTWKKLDKGLPTVAQGLARIGFCVAPSDPHRMYATIDAGAASGIYRSNDAGENWERIQTDSRQWSRGYDFGEIKADPRNADIVYTANVVTWRSVDGGKNWTAFRGAPGGDDYHRIWINPENPSIILIASDQGAVITVNGGESFSSWYNQPTAQFYHVSTDNDFPYHVYGGQQESGSVGISSRSNDGAISFRDWHPVGVEEYGYVAADPLDPNIVYGGKVTRYDKRTGQVQNIAPEAVRSGKYRFLRTAPLLFSPIDKKTLYFAGNVLFKTTNGGKSWQVISPDLTREKWEIPESVGIYNSASLETMPRRGVIYTIAPSYKDINTIWVGTDDGLIHVTKDGGKTWKDVTPPGVSSWSKISIMDAGHFDAQTAYAAVNRIRTDDMKPHIYRTKDGGKTWKEIVNGLPDDPVNVVREDPLRKGLLFAGTERAVYVSFDDGDHWQTLRRNMPATSIRDLVIKDDDLVAGTHGRGFWILDDITPLRQQVSGKGTELFRPQTAIRVRWNMWTDTPLPQEEPAGENPPDGAIIDYYLEKNEQLVTLEILNASGKTVRTYKSTDTLYEIPQVNIPLYWIRPQQVLSAEKGAHRFTWDLRYTPLNVPVSYPIGAIYGNTAPNPTSPWVMPGNYTVRLTTGGRVYTQPLAVKMDPRVKTSLKDLQLQHDLAFRSYQARREVKALEHEVMSAIENLKLLRSRDKGQAPALMQQEDSLSNLLGIVRGTTGLLQLDQMLGSLVDQLQDCDAAPTAQQNKAGIDAMALWGRLKGRWQELNVVRSL